MKRNGNTLNTLPDGASTNGSSAFLLGSDLEGDWK